jgi:putative ABC transport system permease protein
MVMALLIAFAALAAILSGLGMYSVLAYLIARRTHEMGVRMALGARPRHVFGIVLGEGLRMTLSGIVVGLIAAFAITRVMASLLFGVRPTDLATFTAAVVLLFAIAILACFIPARRAANVDPIEALRYE